jgi:chitinase
MKSLLAPILVVALLASACVPDDLEQVARADAFAPFYEVDSTQPPNLPALSKQTGTRWFTLGFVIGSDDCVPTWDSNGGPYFSAALAASIKEIRRTGGDVRLSFGGADGTELALACDSVESLTAAYQKVISAYGITAVDFDLEGDTLKDDEATTRRLAAIGKLTGHPRVSFTLPISRTGLSNRALSVLKQASAAGVAVDAVNVMAMDYGGAEPAMGQRAVDAADDTQAAIAQVWPSKSEAETWRMVAVTVMIGVNDVPSEIFTTADAALLIAAAMENHYGWLSFWSVNRDRACPATPCSGVPQRAYAYSALFSRYQG